MEPLWDVPRRRRFPVAPTPPTVDDSYRERRRDDNRHEPEAIVFSRVTSPSDSEPHSIPMNSRRLPSRRRGWGKFLSTDQVQYAYNRLLIAARLDPDGNEISTDEEEMIERARTITRRNNPQPFFNLFRPVVRGSSDSPADSRGDNTGALEAQIPSRSDNLNMAQPSDTGEGSLEVTGFHKLRRSTKTESTTLIHNPGSVRSQARSYFRGQLHQSSADAPSRDDLFSEHASRSSGAQSQAQNFEKGHSGFSVSAPCRSMKRWCQRDLRLPRDLLHAVTPYP